MKVLYNEYHYRHWKCCKGYPKNISNSCLISTYSYLISCIGSFIKYKLFLIEFIFFQLIFQSIASQDFVYSGDSFACCSVFMFTVVVVIHFRPIDSKRQETAICIPGLEKVNIV